jgi:predicted dehydrogenase
MAETLGIGIIGSGSIASVAHLPGYRAIADKCRVIAVADIDADRAVKFAKENSVPKAFGDYRLLLDLDEIDAVSVCTPPSVHADATIDALNAGKHVICEKPMAMNAAEATAMVKAAKKNGKVLAVDFQMRFAREAQLLKQIVDDGELGDIYFARSVYNRRRGIPAWGVFHRREYSGGGALMDLGVHVIDLTLWLMGHPQPVSVLGATYTKFGKREGVFNRWGDWNVEEFDVEDFAVATVNLENGATLVLETSWALNIEKDQQTLQLSGDQGGANLFPLKVYKDRGTALMDWTPRDLKKSQPGHAMSIANFVDAAREDGTPLVSGDDGLIVARIVDALYESADSGQLVRLD